MGSCLHDAYVVVLTVGATVLPAQQAPQAGPGSVVINEGGPALGNLNVLAQQHGTAYGPQGNTTTGCTGGGCGSGNSNTGLGVITDGDGHASVFTGYGHVISTP